MLVMAPRIRPLLPLLSFLKSSSTFGILALTIVLTTAKQSKAFTFVDNKVPLQASTNVTGRQFNISVGINSSSPNATNVEISTRNVINTWNNLVPTTGNLLNSLQTSQMDFESVLLHEMGHSLGLGHPNIARRQDVALENEDYTASTTGANNAFDFDAGADGIIGSSDDIRGDDGNLNYFRVADNDPFNPNLGKVDSTTYSRELNDLPNGDRFSANADRTVGAALGYVNTESVLQQGTLAGEVQRTLGADDVAGILYSLTGLDELAGTEDDYTFNLTYAGLTNQADILIGFDNAKTDFADTEIRIITSLSDLITPSDNRAIITGSNIFFNDQVDWFFNDVSNNAETIPTPALLPGLMGMGWAALRRKKRELAERQGR